MDILRYGLIFLFVTLGTSLSYANEVLKCLGQEELSLHRAKDIGPEYKLNQLFVNEFASNSDITIKEVYQKQICENRHHPPSVTILKLLLTKGKSIFIIKGEFGREGLEGYKIERIENLLSRIAHIFFSYIGALQSKAATHDCLKKHIPEIAHFEDRFKYLENEYPAKKLLQESDKFEKIFNKLKNLRSIYRSCAAEAEQRRKAKEAELKRRNAN